MADEIKLKAPTVEQQVILNIQGEEKLRSFADTIDKISNNKNLQKYWKTQQELINDTADAYGNFSKKASQDNAKELIKVTNALKAMSGTDLSNILPDFDKISKALIEAKKVAGNIDSAFSVKGFKEAFDSFETLKAYEVDMQNLFSHFDVSSDVNELRENVRALEGEVGKLTRRLINAKNENEELRKEFENYKTDSGIADKLDELDNLKSEMSYLREQAEETFKAFLRLNNISESGYTSEGWQNNRFEEYFDKIQSGYYTASDAIREFKSEYAYLLEESFKSNNDTFGLEQLQAFSNKLDSIFRQVEEIFTKINDIISNGVITKSVENLSMDSSLSDSQRSLFGSLLKDEESLKSITALFQKLIEESNKTSKVDLFNNEQLQQVLSIFDKMEGHLSSLRSIISDVGDGEEFSPLLKALNDIKEAASNIKLNFNMDLGDEVSERLNQKISQASARQLEAYRKLFSAMKGTGKTNKEMLTFFEPDEAAVTELIGMYQGIIKRAEEQFKVGNSNVYKKILGSEYDTLKREITNANKQLSRADSKRSENGILGDLFGNTKDLSKVIEQLDKIVSKLDEISSSASEFKNVFKEGFNVTASVEEIGKLTNRVKELEDELSKIKLNPANVDKSNISSGTQIKDVIQGETEKSGMDAIASATEEAIQAKKDFATANEGVQSSIDGSKSPLQLEADLMGQIAKSAREAADAKKEFVEANKQVKDSADASNGSTKKDKYKDKSKVSEDDYSDSYFASIANKKLSDNGFTILGESVNTELVDGLVKVNAKIKTTEGTWKTFSAKIDADGNMFEQRFRTITKGVDKLETELENFGRETSPALTYQETLDKANEIRDKLQLGGEYSIKVDSNELVTITKKLSDVNSTATSVTQTFKSAEDAIQNFGQSASNSAEKTSVALKGVKANTKASSNAYDAKAAEQEAKALEKAWEEANKVNNALNETKKTLSSLSRMPELDTQFASLNTKLSSLNSELTSGKISVTDYQKEVKSLTSEYSKLAAIQQNRDVETYKQNAKAAEQEAKAVKNLNNELQSYRKQIPKKPADGQRSDNFDILVKSYEKAINDAQNYLNALGNSPITEDVKKKWQSLIDLIEVAKSKMDAVPKAARGSDADSRMKEIDKLTKYLDKNTRISKDAREELERYLALLKSNDASVNVKEIHTAWTAVAVAEREAGREGKSFIDILKNKTIYGYAAQLAGYYLSFMDLIRYTRNAVSAVQELDTALVDLKKTTTMTNAQLEDFYYSSNAVAKRMGVTTAEIINQASAWSRLNKIGLLYGDI